MTKSDKLLQKLSSKPKTFKYNELRKLLSALGYDEIVTGNTSGSRVAFYTTKKDHLIRLHKPHPGNELKKYQIDLIYNELKSQGYIE
ncbi:MAG: type II toxin-antitoxin system HicA family toxin [Gammaproteobacteria bacterium]|nr:type II toxin-antitoxin system HicA family toxin [Gammaproteobacteria bacterium]